MGSCGCKIIFPEPEAHPEDFRANTYNTQITSQNTLNIIPCSSNELTKFKEKFEKEKLPELGTYITIEEFDSLIKDSIKEYLKNNSFKVPDIYKIKIKTYPLDPIKYKNGNIYYGYWNESFEMEGYGKFFLQSKNILTEGIWRQGKLVYGKVFYKNDEKYIGEISDSGFHGKGQFFSINGEKYEGDFFRGQKSGIGKITYLDGTIYEGDVKNGLFNGKGKIKWGNINIEYTGHFNSSSLDGYGILINEIGDKYEGYFNNNNFNGNGTYKYNNGDVFIGEYENGEMKGRGLFIRSDGFSFEGWFDNDLPNGRGKIGFKNNFSEVIYKNGVIVNNEIKVLEGSKKNFGKINLNIIPKKQFICNDILPHLLYQDNVET